MIGLPVTSDASVIPLTVTHLLEHLFCPRFSYFEYALRIPERQEKRPLVMKGREVHEERRRTNPTYLRKKLGVLGRDFDVPLASARLGVRGSVDEVFTLADGSLAPFDYKFAEAPRQIFLNQKMQSVLYGLLIEEVLGRPVHRGYLCFVRSKHKIVEVPHTEEDRNEVRQTLAEILDIIRDGVFPQATRYKARCLDCCYRNICIQ